MHEVKTDGWINFARSMDPAVWLRVSEIQAVLSDRPGTTVVMKNGERHTAPLTSKNVIEAITGGPTHE